VTIRQNWNEFKSISHVSSKVVEAVGTLKGKMSLPWQGSLFLKKGCSSSGPLRLICTYGCSSKDS